MGWIMEARQIYQVWGATDLCFDFAFSTPLPPVIPQTNQRNFHKDFSTKYFVIRNTVTISFTWYLEDHFRWETQDILFRGQILQLPPFFWASKVKNFVRCLAVQIRVSASNDENLVVVNL